MSHTDTDNGRSPIANQVNKLRHNQVFYTEIQPPIGMYLQTGDDDVFETREYHIEFVRIGSDDKVIIQMRDPEGSDDEFWRLKCIPIESDQNMRIMGDPDEYRLKLVYYSESGVRRLVGNVDSFEVLSHD